MSTKIQFPFGEAQAEKSHIEEIRPGTTEITLEDGAVLGLHIVPLEVYRTDEKKDASGNPFYSINSQIVVKVVRSPNSNGA